MSVMVNNYTKINKAKNHPNPPNITKTTTFEIWVLPWDMINECGRVKPIVGTAQ